MKKVIDVCLGISKDKEPELKKREPEKAFFGLK